MSVPGRPSWERACMKGDTADGSGSLEGLWLWSLRLPWDSGR